MVIFTGKEESVKVTVGRECIYENGDINGKEKMNRVSERVKIPLFNLGLIKVFWPSIYTIIEEIRLFNRGLLNFFWPRIYSIMEEIRLQSWIIKIFLAQSLLHHQGHFLVWLLIVDLSKGRL